MIQIDVHFWNEYVPCHWKRNQSNEPRDMLLSSKIGIDSIKNHISCREMIQGFRKIVWTDI